MNPPLALIPLRLIGLKLFPALNALIRLNPNLDAQSLQTGQRLKLAP